MADKAKLKKTTKKAKAPEKATPSKKTRKRENLWVIKSFVKTHIKEKGDHFISPAFYETLSKEVKVLCDKAVERARGNGRKTIRPEDA
uniref:Histone H2A/H2B/H3 domain-containing protein n=1 Tax=Candidatus Kentrum sp. SD TaxID=2126332 RepID=A0A450Z010_9GAMM|nr:MAG: hypothetical protein BECKSD772F_GA0070984_12383 [Candidatus Kentron sp. SD]VFK47124.1 MAG: hypothetical protein BECKSD772E_GA0070983_10883 [Candidatus Kentron sp. SD]VFK81402.1 MAG: hypothetical protein BECKSD772D_GA0070982_13612 [Candidatus Kentron sp. SD]